MYRVLLLLELHPEHRMPVDQLRILDFYFLFPHLLADVKLMRGHIRWKRKLAATRSKYNHVPAPQMLLSQIRPLQEVALLHLAGEGYFDKQALDEKLAIKTSRSVPPTITKLFSEQSDERELAEFLAKEVSKIKLTGVDGLKDRTGLLEYRYDPD